MTCNETDLAGPVGEADAVFIAVGTPSRRGDGHADLSYVYTAAREIAAAVSGFTVDVSTAPFRRISNPHAERELRAKVIRIRVCYHGALRQDLLHWRR
jgi:UDPglucose 6-dehydrogenase